MSFSRLAFTRKPSDTTGIYEVTLLVGDGKPASAAKDIINIVAISPNTTKVTDTGTYRCALLTKQMALTLYAQGHAYLDRDQDAPAKRTILRTK
ncbi:hypothetical protein [Massilia aquatica]|uniref:Ig-like domain-containing protein n=1 Tax=Massilia aquatica TaxID=2609000 RepID=A0ABX0M764_9BURK|nr:hypothetical protein [Massilia aquatica]NHZ40855.1 hypothetical protein [Massilia aquatica]